MAVGQDELESLAAALGSELLARGWRISGAESCTGGWACQALTAIAGSSAWFDRGFVTYSNEAKQEMLGVRPGTLRNHGAVSLETVKEMARGGLASSHAQVSFAISGIAGPGGGSPDKPVGTVCFAWMLAGQEPEAIQVRFDGDRQAVREQSVAWVFRRLRSLLADLG